MPDVTRAKFRCDSTVDRGYGVEVTLRPVYSPEADHENRKFWKATPNGYFTMTIENLPAAAIFEKGAEYYIDISRAA